MASLRSAGWWFCSAVVLGGMILAGPLATTEAAPRRIVFYGPRTVYVQSVPVQGYSLPTVQSSAVWTSQGLFLTQAADAFDSAGGGSPPAREAGGTTPSTPTPAGSSDCTKVDERASYKASLGSAKSILCRLEEKHGLTKGACEVDAPVAVKPAPAPSDVDLVALVRSGLADFDPKDRKAIAAAIKTFNKPRLLQLRNAGKTLAEIARVVLGVAVTSVPADKITRWLDLSEKVLDLLGKRSELQSAPVGATADDDRIIEFITRELADAVSRP